jgi:cytochrome P450
MGPSLDLRDPAFREDPYPLYARLRREAPVQRQRMENGVVVWWISRHADVDALLRDPRFGVEEEEMEGEVPEALLPLVELVRATMLRRDPPDHTRLRGLVSRAFTPKRVERLRPRVEALVEQLLAPYAEDAEIDAIGALAAPLPALVMAELLGLPAKDRERLEHWSGAIAPMLDGSIRNERAGSILRGALELSEYLGAAVRARRERPGDDLISALVQAQAERDALSDVEVIATSVLLLAAGHETTTNLIGNGLRALLEHRREHERLVAEPRRIPDAVEEMLRFDSPVQVTSRRAREPVEIAGVAVPPREEIDLLFGSANRDPEAFPEPDRFDVGRFSAGSGAPQHLAFGRGTHFCLGAALARMEAQTAFGALLARAPGLALADGPFPRRPGYVLRGFERRAVRLGG